jgi:hypothetical protein
MHDAYAIFLAAAAGSFSTLLGFSAQRKMKQSTDSLARIVLVSAIAGYICALVLCVSDPKVAFACGVGFDLIVTSARSMASWAIKRQ